jgi:hypothetical protein
MVLILTGGNGMKLKSIILLTLVLIIVSTACKQTVLTAPIDRKTPMFESARQAQERADTIAAVKNFVSLQTGLDLEIIEFLRYETVTWDNLCLGFPGSNEICPVDTVDGYVFYFVVNSFLYEVHSDKNGSNIRLAPDISVSNPPIESVVNLLSSQLKIPSEQIRFLNSIQMNWQDSCLEYPSNDNCSPAIIPGYLIVLEAQNQKFEYHTNLDGSLIIGNLVSKTNEEPLLSYQSTNDNCINVEFYSETVMVQSCNNESQSIGSLSDQDQAKLLTLLTTYAPFINETPEGVIHLFGLGSANVTENETVSIAEWAKSIFEPLITTTATIDPLEDYILLAMERHYFEAKTVERLLITRDLLMVISNNEGFEKRDLTLSVSDLDQLLAWGKTFAANKFTIRDEVAKWETEISFYGNGQQTLNESDQQAIVTFALQRYAENASGETK